MLRMFLPPSHLYSQTHKHDSIISAIRLKLFRIPSLILVNAVFYTGMRKLKFQSQMTSNIQLLPDLKAVLRFGFGYISQWSMLKAI